MLSNYIKITLRNLLKNKGQTFINIGGLTLGVLCAVVIFLTIQYEYSYDTWHPDSDRLYRVIRQEIEFGEKDQGRGIHYPLAAAIRDEVSGVERSTIIDNNFANDPIITYTGEDGIQKKFKEENAAYIEQDYFEIVNYNWISGDQKTALSSPNKVVITESFSKKVYGNVNSLGKTLTVNMRSVTDLEVTGVVADPPDNSDFPFVMMASHNSKSREGTDRLQSDNWSGTSSGHQVYLKLLSGVSTENVSAQLDSVISRNRTQDESSTISYFLQPFSDIHFNPEFSSYNRTVDKTSLYALGVIGFFLLLAACINFINLNTAVAAKRSKEVGLRKTLGGTRLQLTMGFLGETGFITLFSIVIALALTEVVLINMESVLGFVPVLDLLQNTGATLFLISLLIGITFAAGWYPAQYLSKFTPIDAIRNKITASYSEGINLRRGLIIVQFGITQILIICTVIISTQIDYFNARDLGFDKEAVVQVPLLSGSRVELNTFKNNLKANSSIRNVTFSNTGTAGGSVWGGNYIQMEDTIRKEGNTQIKFIDPDFIDTYGLRLLAGKNIEPSDSINMFVVNETYAREVGYEGRYNELLGSLTRVWGSEAPIVGVVEDFTTQSLHSDVQAVVLGARRNYFVAGVKIDMARSKEALNILEDAYNASFPNFVFEYTFLDEEVGNFYADEERVSQIMRGFTVIAILIGCLGLFGLVSYMASTRTKEIGVRKVLGATIMDILRLFGKELAILLTLSFIIAAPVSYYFMNEWLAEFAYKINIGAGIFVISLASTLLIALFTVGYKSMRAALANPVDSLKSE